MSTPSSEDVSDLDYFLQYRITLCYRIFILIICEGCCYNRLLPEILVLCNRDNTEMELVCITGFPTPTLAVTGRYDNYFCEAQKVEYIYYIHGTHLYNYHRELMGSKNVVLV